MTPAAAARRRTGARRRRSSRPRAPASPVGEPAADDADDADDAAAAEEASDAPTDGPAPSAPGAPGVAAWGDDSLVRLTGSAPSAELDADGWALVAAMADTIPVQILASRLGWSQERIVEVLEGLRELGAVAEESFGVPAFTPPASAAG